MRPSPSRAVAGRLDPRREAEVRQLEPQAVVEQQVAGLDVTVHEALPPV